MKSIIIHLLRFYQKILSPDRGVIKYILPSSRGCCTMYPSCSEYMILSVEKKGTMRGIMSGIGRIFRCHPWQKQLVDLP